MNTDTTLAFAVALGIAACAYEAKADVITSAGFKTGAGASFSSFNGSWYQAGAYTSDVGDLFCVEIEQGFTFKKPTEYTVSKVVPDDIRNLFASYFDGSHTGDFQTALWQLTNPADYILTSSPVALIKNSSPITWDLTLYTSATHQDLIGYKPAPAPVPVPGPMFLFGSGLLALYVTMKEKRAAYLNSLEAKDRR